MTLSILAQSPRVVEIRVLQFDTISQKIDHGFLKIVSDIERIQTAIQGLVLSLQASAADLFIWRGVSARVAVVARY